MSLPSDFLLGRRGGADNDDDSTLSSVLRRLSSAEVAAMMACQGCEDDDAIGLRKARHNNQQTMETNGWGDGVDGDEQRRPIT